MSLDDKSHEALTPKVIERMRAAGKAGYLDTGCKAWDLLCDLALASLRSHVAEKCPTCGGTGNMPQDAACEPKPCLTCEGRKTIKVSAPSTTRRKATDPFPPNEEAAFLASLIPVTGIEFPSMAKVEARTVWEGAVSWAQSATRRIEDEETLDLIEQWHLWVMFDERGGIWSASGGINEGVRRAGRAKLGDAVRECVEQLRRADGGTQT